MKISIVGAGYVGLVTGLCLADEGHDVVSVDYLGWKVDMLNNGACPMFEKDLDSILERNVKVGRFRATTDMREIAPCPITFICVGTPSNQDGTLDLRYVLAAAKDIGEAIRDKKEEHIVVVKSTVPPGTTEGTIIPEIERSSGRKNGEDFGVAVNPEFLREGNAVYDFKHPDRIVIGTDDPRSLGLLEKIYSSIEAPIVRVTPSTAEMIKLASNVFLAARISLINEIGNICKVLHIDVREVARGVGLDKRIGPEFLRAGCGFGGSCFTKDIKGLAALARDKGIEPALLEDILRVNEGQAERMIKLLEDRMTVRGKTVGILGLAFKPDTDDIRESVSHRIVKGLISRGAKVAAHDYKAMDNFRKEFPNIDYCSDPEECVAKSDAVLIVTEWSGYADPTLYGDKLVIDGRGIVNTSHYEGICW